MLEIEANLLIPFGAMARANLPGIYILQNTMVRGEGGKWSAGGKKIKIRSKGKKNEKGKKKV